MIHHTIKKNLFYIFVIFILGLYCMAFHAIAEEEEEFNIMPVSDIKKGMVGIGRTVVEGTTIEEFEVEVISVFQGVDSLPPYILVKVSGDAIERSGGISAGMSGSPVYIDGKLVGAISHRYQEADHTIGLLTPAEEMIKLFNYDKYAIASSKGTIAFNFDGEVYNFIPVQSPVLVTGMGNRAFDILKRGFEKRGVNLMNLKVSDVEGVTDLPEELPIEPGSAIGVQLVRGAINVVAIGTVTYKEGSNILAFGHPFLNAGPVNFFASSAYVHNTIKSEVMPFKIASPIKTIGTVTQDRNAGLVTVLNNGPQSVSARLTVIDLDIKREKNYYFQIVRDPTLLPELLGTTFLQGIDYTIDRLGPGTSEVSFYVRTRDGAGSFTRNNIFYSEFDVAAVSLYEVISYIAALLNNDIADVEIIDVGVQVKIKSRRRTAQIVAVRVDTENPSPGDEIVVQVDLKPYREELVTIPVKLKIPEGTSLGEGYITVYSGESLFGSYYDEWGIEEDSGVGESQRVEKDLKEFVNNFANSRKNNELVVEFQSYYVENEGMGANVLPVMNDEVNVLPDIENSSKFSLTNSKTPRVIEPSDYSIDGETFEESGTLKVVVPTDYVLSGWASLDIIVGDEN